MTEHINTISRLPNELCPAFMEWCVRGVYWHKQRGKWAACIRHNGKNISLGLYDDLEEAKKSRLSKELEIWDADDTYQTKAMIEARESANESE